MIQMLTVVCLVIGCLFIVIASLGVYRMPDLAMRMHASSKAATLGASFVFLGVIFYFSALSVTTKGLLTIIILFVTAPVASHLIARAGYITGVPLYEGTIVDELKGRYKPDEQIIKDTNE